MSVAKRSGRHPPAPHVNASTARSIFCYATPPFFLPFFLLLSSTALTFWNSSFSFSCFSASFSPLRYWLLLFHLLLLRHSLAFLLYSRLLPLFSSSGFILLSSLFPIHLSTYLACQASLFQPSYLAVLMPSGSGFDCDCRALQRRRAKSPPAQLHRLALKVRGVKQLTNSCEEKHL